MPARTRERIWKSVSGSLTSGHPFNNEFTSVKHSYEYCNDFIGNPQGDNALRITKEYMEGPHISGVNGVHSFSTYGTAGTSYYPSVPSTTSVTNALKALAPRLYSQSGPLTPRLNIPRAIIELRDLPMMLKHAGDLLLKVGGGRRFMSPDAELASSTLAYQFGWAPIIEDLSKMVKISEIIDRRHRELEKAHSQRGLKRRISLGSSSTTGPEGSEVFLSTAGSQTLKGRRSNTQTSKRWATIRWRAADPDQWGRPPSRAFAAASATGFRLGQIPVTLWQVLPWTWLIDWFADVAARMQALSNLWEYTPSNACVMETIESVDTWRITQNSAGLAIGGLENRRIIKSRVVLATSDLALNPIKLPYLDGFKLSILGSLAVLRLHRR